MAIGTYRAADISRPLVAFGPHDNFGQRRSLVTIPAAAVAGDTIDFMVLPKDVRILDVIVDVIDPGATDMDFMLHLASLPGGKTTFDVQATGTLTGTTIAAADTVDINGVEYTFVDTLTDDPAPVPYEVLVGASDSDSLDNLIAAINGAAGAGTLYGAGTVAHPDVTAAAGAGDTMVVTAIVGGLAGNAVTTTAALTSGDFAAATLTGGSGRILLAAASIVDPVVLRRDVPGSVFLDDGYALQGVLSGDDQDADQDVEVTAIFEYVRTP